MKLLFILGLVAVVSSRPQDVGVDDILGAANSARYGGNEEPADGSLIDDVFGGSGKTGGDGYAGDGGNSNVNEIVDTSYDECTYYADQGYKCVPYYTCEDGEIVTDGGGLIDIRSSFNAILDPGSSKCEGYLEVCCRHPDYSTNAPIVPTTYKPTTPKPRVYQPQCGKRNVGGIGVRIQNDKYKGSTQFGEWPHMCAVLETKAVADADAYADADAEAQELNLYVCGASLIAPGVILTGAHCVAKLDPANIKIRCGEWDTQQQVEPSPHQDRYVESVKFHPLFDSRNLQNDFALLFLKKDFVLSPHIDTICLPDNLAGIYDYEQQDCFATGWGKDKFGKEGNYQVIMKQVQMDIVDSPECQRRLRRTRLGEGFNLHESFICAGGEKGKDTCKGDGGGPLVCPKKVEAGYGGETTYVQAGIIAWGIDCGVEGNPGVYANVADGLCFISWATQCQTGVPNYFNIGGCEDWANKEIIILQKKIAKYQNKLNVITADGSGTPSNIRNLKRRIDKAQALLNAFEKTESICVGGVDGGYGGDGDIDISSLGRKGENEGYSGGGVPPGAVDGGTGFLGGNNGGVPAGVVDGGTGFLGGNEGGAYDGGVPPGAVDGGTGFLGGNNGGVPAGVVDGGTGFLGGNEGGAYDGGVPPGAVDGGTGFLGGNNGGVPGGIVDGGTGFLGGNEGGAYDGGVPPGAVDGGTGFLGGNNGGGHGAGATDNGSYGENGGTPLGAVNDGAYDGSAIVDAPAPPPGGY